MNIKRVEPSSLALLEKLVSFPTVSGSPNLELVDWIEEALRPTGARFQRFAHSSGDRTNLWITIGPKEVPGIIFSGHLDVVPAPSGKAFYDPFTMRVADGRAYGRGTADMKGFIACAVRAAMLANASKLKRPLHLAFSYDEELGCIGVRDMLQGLADLEVTPLLCLVGEPTDMQLVVAHKGKTMGKIVCIGAPGHSSDPSSGVNALHVAMDVVSVARNMQEELRGRQSAKGFTVPFTTLHLGTIYGGTALNVIPEVCEIGFEIRNAPSDDVEDILSDLQKRAETVARAYHRNAKAVIEIHNSYPALDSDPSGPAVALLKNLLSEQQTAKVSYGTEAGLFARELRLPALVCGPGSVKQAHRNDEYIELEQLAACDLLLARLVDLLTTDFSFGEAHDQHN